jgi:hypothetical protein
MRFAPSHWYHLARCGRLIRELVVSWIVNICRSKDTCVWQNSFVVLLSLDSDVISQVTKENLLRLTEWQISWRLLNINTQGIEQEVVVFVTNNRLFHRSYYSISASRIRSSSSIRWPIENPWRQVKIFKQGLFSESYGWNIVSTAISSSLPSFPLKSIGSHLHVFSMGHRIEEDDHRTWCHRSCAGVIGWSPTSKDEGSDDMVDLWLRVKRRVEKHDGTFRVCGSVVVV